MTNIILHGILAREFGENFRMQIHKAANVIKAIDVNRKNFNKRIFELSREGLNYTMIVDGKKITELQELNIQKEPQEIHLVPLIIGAGGFAIATAIFGAAAVAAGGIAGFTALAINFVIMTAISIGLQMLLAPKPDGGPEISATTKALRESFTFSNKANTAAQGVPVPVGYGRLKVGSQLIQMSIKSYSQSSESIIAMSQNPYVPTTVGTPITLSEQTSNRV